MAVVSVEICNVEQLASIDEPIFRSPMLIQHLAGASNINAAGNTFATDQPLITTDKIWYARVITDGACRVAFGTTPSVTATTPDDREVSTAAMLVTPYQPLIVRVKPNWKVATGAA